MSSRFLSISAMQLLFVCIVAINVNNLAFAQDPIAEDLAVQITDIVPELREFQISDAKFNIQRRISTLTILRENGVDEMMTVFPKQLWPSHFMLRREQLQKLADLKDKAEIGAMIDYMAWLSFIDLVTQIQIEKHYSRIHSRMWNRLGLMLTAAERRELTEAEFAVDSLAMQLLNAYDAKLNLVTNSPEGLSRHLKSLGDACQDQVLEDSTK